MLHSLMAPEGAGGLGWRSLAKSCKSGFRVQASKVNYLSKEVNRRTMSLKALARLWKSGFKAQEAQASKVMILVRDSIRT